MKKTVLMADDDEDDSFLAKEAFEANGSEVAFSRVEDGDELMEYLLKRSQSGTEKLPDLILLDLNMPRKDGREALIEIKGDPDLHRIPIAILSTCSEEKDIAFCMKTGAMSFHTKPRTFDEWVKITKSLTESWVITENRKNESSSKSIPGTIKKIQLRKGEKYHE